MSCLYLAFFFGFVSFELFLLLFLNDWPKKIVIKSELS